VIGRRRNPLTFVLQITLVGRWVVVQFHRLLILNLKVSHDWWMALFQHQDVNKLTFSISYSSEYNCFWESGSSLHIWPMILPISQSFESVFWALTLSHILKGKIVVVDQLSLWVFLYYYLSAVPHVGHQGFLRWLWWFSRSVGISSARILKTNRDAKWANIKLLTGTMTFVSFIGVNPEWLLAAGWVNG